MHFLAFPALPSLVQICCLLPQRGCMSPVIEGPSLSRRVSIFRVLPGIASVLSLALCFRGLCLGQRMPGTAITLSHVIAVDGIH